MLEDQLKNPRVLRHCVHGATARQSLDRLQQRATHPIAVFESFLYRWPSLRNFRMPVTFPGVDIRIDTAAEKIVEIGIERWPLEKRAADLIP